MPSNSPFPYSDTEKRYYTYAHYLRRTFGNRCAKLPIDAGFTCPNRDGRVGVGGCTFCSARGSGDFTSPALSIAEQIACGKQKLGGKWQTEQYLAYFQAFTNTYAPLDRLRQCYEAALAEPNIVGLNIATRADCLSDDTVSYLRELDRRTHLTVELGLQTVHDATAKRIHRGHTYEDFLTGYRKLEGLRVCIHIINGLPEEDATSMRETAEAVSALHPHSVKIHLLHILHGTELAEEYEQGAVGVLSKDAYVSIVCDQLELLPPDVVIGRLTGDGAAEELIAPLWSRDKRSVLNAIDRELVRRDSMQGAKYRG